MCFPLKIVSPSLSSCSQAVLFFLVPFCFRFLSSASPFYLSHVFVESVLFSFEDVRDVQRHGFCTFEWKHEFDG